MLVSRLSRLAFRSSRPILPRSSLARPLVSSKFPTTFSSLSSASVVFQQRGFIQRLSFSTSSTSTSNSSSSSSPSTPTSSAAAVLSTTGATHPPSSSPAPTPSLPAVDSVLPPPETSTPPALPENEPGRMVTEQITPKPFSHMPTVNSWDEVPVDSIVKVFAVVSPPNYIQPWQNKLLKEVTGSGFAIVGRKVLTNAHVVADQKYVTVKKQGSAIKFPAKVIAVGHECDLAVLSIEDERFWEGMEELEFSDIPHLQEQVTVVGYPIGGDNLSVTRGVVSRVEPQQYAHGATKLLAIQIDAAINPGNSGGPALQGNKVVGVAFQNLQGAENIGFIIPVPIIHHFLKDIELNKHYVGFCDIGITCQALENSHFQSIMGLRPDQKHTGVVVNAVHRVSPAFDVLKKYDVIRAIDGHVIASDGSIKFRGRERIPFDYLLSHKFAGDVLRLDIIRNGQEMTKEVVLAPVQHLVPVFQYDTIPSYIIYGGLVFVPLTQPYLHEYGYDWYNSSPRRLCHLAMNGKRMHPDQQVVILSQILMDDVNVGYQRMIDTVIHKVNGIEIRNLKHLRDILDDLSTKCEAEPASFVDAAATTVSDSTSSSPSSPSASAAPSPPSSTAATSTSASTGSSDLESDTFVRDHPGTVVFETDNSRLVVIDAKAAKRAEQEILKRHRIPSSRSPDLL